MTFPLQNTLNRRPLEYKDKEFSRLRQDKRLAEIAPPPTGK